MQSPISITAISSVSALGNDPTEIWNNYKKDDHFIAKKEIGGREVYVSPLSESAEKDMGKLQNEDHKYKSLDRSVLMAMVASRNAITKADWKPSDDFGVNLGSSRGATILFEKYHSDFLRTGNAQTLSSPLTTLGNISSWVAQDLRTNGPEISHSITCSTALHALLNGVAWINSGMANKFLVGGTESPLTDFTLAQMRAMKIYASPDNTDFPCRSFDLEKTKNSMVLGEGASVCCLEKGIAENRIATIIGIGYGTENLEHATSISDDGDCFQKSMAMALEGIDRSSVDAIVMHAPGTLKGDNSECNAIKKIFGESLPNLTTNKWKLGHTFGASGMLSLELAAMMIDHDQFIDVPFGPKQFRESGIKKVLVNAVGFGGNAVSVLISK